MDQKPAPGERFSLTEESLIENPELRELLDGTVLSAIGDDSYWRKANREWANEVGRIKGNTIELEVQLTDFCDQKGLIEFIRDGYPPIKETEFKLEEKKGIYHVTIRERSVHDLFFKVRNQRGAIQSMSVMRVYDTLWAQDDLKTRIGKLTGP